MTLFHSKAIDKESSPGSLIMGTSQSKRNTKISKIRSATVGATGDFGEGSNSLGKLSSLKGICQNALRTWF